MTEADIVKLHEVWPEGARDRGLMIYQAPSPILDILAAHPWDSHELSELIHREHRSRMSPRLGH